MRARLIVLPALLALIGVFAPSGQAVPAREGWQAQVDQVRRAIEVDVPAGLVAAEQLAASLPAAAPPADRVRVINLRARAYAYLGDTAAAARATDEALALARASGDMVGEAEALLVVSLNAINQARIDLLVSATTGAVAALEKVDRPDLMTEALLRLSAMSLRFGQLDDAVMTAMNAAETANRAGGRLAAAFAHQGMAIAFDQTGRTDDAFQQYQAMLEQARAAPSRMLEVFALLGLAGQQARRGEYAAAHRSVEDALRAQEGTHALPVRQFALFAQAELYRQEGRHAQSLELFDQVVRGYEAYPNPIGLWYGLSARGAARERLGQRAEADADAQRAYELARRIGFPLYLSESARQMAARAATAGDSRRAYQLMVEAAEMSANAQRERARIRVAELTQRYREQTRARSLAELTQRNRDQAVEIERQALRQRWLWTLVGAAALLLTGAAVFTRRVQRQRRELAALNETLERRVEERTRDLEQARRAAEQGALAKSEFLAHMSHEIRTPMNGILGMAWLVLQGELSARQRHQVTQLHRSAETLLGILNDILDFSKIEAGQLHLEQVEFRLDDVLDQVVGLLGPRAAEKGLELLLEVDPAVPQVLVGDPMRLGQVLLNLGHNAVKFTGRGEVAIRVRMPPHDAGPQALAFEVRDTGIGIDGQALRQLFQPFVQADASTTRLFGGSGLGLAICRRLVELMGGRIGAESQPGAGSVFSFTVAVGRPGQPPEPAEPVPRAVLAGLRLLVADAHAGAGAVALRTAGALGLEGALAADADAALQHLGDAALQGQPFELVLVDAGLEGLPRLLAQGRAGGPPLVVVLLPPGQAEPPADSGLPAGALATLNKPLTARALAQAAAWARGLADPARATPAAIEAPAQGPRFDGVRVLLVEDHPVNRELASDLLERAGARVVLAEDGHEALDQLARSRFDLVLMDCQMPGMDGYAATMALRARPGGQEVPVVAMTANAMVGDRERALAAGMNDYVTKPIRVKQLMATLARWLPARPAAPPPPPAPPALPPRSWAGDPALYNRLMALFVERERQFARRFRAALEAGDLATCRRLAHDLKSVAATLAESALAEVGARLEHVGAGDAEPEPALQRLIDEADRKVTELAARLAPARIGSTIAPPAADAAAVPPA